MAANAAPSPLNYESIIPVMQRQIILYHNFLCCKDYFFQKAENFFVANLQMDIVK